jgi:hypothetical protein
MANLSLTANGFEINLFVTQFFVFFMKSQTIGYCLLIKPAEYGLFFPAVDFRGTCKLNYFLMPQAFRKGFQAFKQLTKNTAQRVSFG